MLRDWLCVIFSFQRVYDALSFSIIACDTHLLLDYRRVVHLVVVCSLYARFFFIVCSTTILYCFSSQLFSAFSNCAGLFNSICSHQLLLNQFRIWLRSCSLITLTTVHDCQVVEYHLCLDSLISQIVHIDLASTGRRRYIADLCMRRLCTS